MKITIIKRNISHAERNIQCKIKPYSAEVDLWEGLERFYTFFGIMRRYTKWNSIWYYTVVQ